MCSMQLHSPNHLQCTVGLKITPAQPLHLQNPPAIPLVFSIQSNKLDKIQESNSQVTSKNSEAKSEKNSFLFDDWWQVFPHTPKHKIWIKFGRTLLSEFIEMQYLPITPHTIQGLSFLYTFPWHFNIYIYIKLFILLSRHLLPSFDL